MSNLDKIERLIADDAYAISFQTMGQYRTALLQEIKRLADPAPEPTRPPQFFVVWDEKFGLAYRGKVYETLEGAEKAKQGIVWHSRERYVARGADLREIRTHLNALAVSAPSGDEKCGDAPSVNVGGSGGDPPTDDALLAVFERAWNEVCFGENGVEPGDVHDANRAGVKAVLRAAVREGETKQCEFRAFGVLRCVKPAGHEGNHVSDP